MAGSPLTARVHQHLDADAPARDILARGALSLRAMARWLIRAHAWTDATEDAVVSALRRYPVTRGAAVIPAAQSALARGHVNSRGNVTALTVSRSRDAHRALARVMSTLDAMRGDALRVLEGERALRVIVTDARVPDVRALLPPDLMRDEHAGLVECTLVLPQDTRPTASALALACHALAAHDVRVTEAATCGPELLILVHARDASRALQVLVRLTQRSLA